jgi:hypothetical protein
VTGRQVSIVCGSRVPFRVFVFFKLVSCVDGSDYKVDYCESVADKETDM